MIYSVLSFLIDMELIFNFEILYPIIRIMFVLSDINDVILTSPTFDRNSQRIE